MAKINKHFIKWMDEGMTRKTLSDKIDRVPRQISRYRLGEILPPPDIMKAIDKLSKGKVPPESWF